MFRLLGFEFQKVFRGKAVYICAAVMCAFTVLMVYTCSLSYTGNVADECVRKIFGTDTHMYILAVIIPLMICTDIGNGTLRVLLGRGFSRNTVWLAEVITVFTVSLCLLALNFVVGCISMPIFGITGSISSDSIFIVVEQLYSYIVIAFFMYFLAKLFKKNAAAISLGIVGPILITLILAVVTMIIGNPGFDANDYFIASYPLIFDRIINEGAKLTQTNLCMLAYLLVFGISTYFITKKLDV